LLAPLRGPHRAGQMDVAKALANNRRVAPGAARSVGYTAQMAPYVGLPAALLQGWGQNVGANSAAKRQRRERDKVAFATAMARV
jgi:hypothetical protein